MSARRTPARPARLATHAAAALLAASALGCAAAAARQRPEAGLAVTREDGAVVHLDSTTTEFEVDGVRVIHRANFATDVVAASIYLLGGTRQLTAETQGVEAMLLRAAEYGSAAYPGARSREAWGDTGSELSIEPDADWTRYAFRGVRAEFDRSWDVFADRVVRPQLAERDVAVVRGRLAASLRHRRASPDGLAFLLGDSVAYAGHPYALSPGGTEASLARLDSAALARYHRAHVVRSRLLVVVVGGVDSATVAAAVARSLAALPAGSYVWTLPDAPPVARPARGAGPVVSYVARPAQTNYVLGVFHGPSADAPDAPAFRLAAALLGGRLNRAVREERGLSYAAYAPYYDRGRTAAAVYVSTVAPERALDVMRAQLDSTRRDATLAGSMQFFTQQFVTGHIGSNMTSDAQGDALARAALLLGDWRRASREMDALRRVSAGAVRAAAARYLTGARWVYVGDSTRARRTAFEGF